jgi:FkbM family methyltransferase
VVDYSQYEQALILRQLVTKDTPKILVDIGAHDGICGSNSRELLEHGWRGVLVEPMPAVYARLVQNSQGIRQVKLVHAACGDRDGTATMRVGKDGPDGQMGSFSTDPSIVENLSEESVEVPVRTLSSLVAENAIPEDFGVLLVDTEGWDLNVLQGLNGTPARPRIIVTEDFSATNTAKRQLLTGLGYTCAGNWGGDSFWISTKQKVDISGLHLPVLSVASKWKPSGKPIGPGHVNIDESASFRYTVAGWAWNESFLYPETEVFVSLCASGSHQTDLFRAWSLPRPDVAAAFGSPSLLMSGFRANVNVAPGPYEVTVIQQGRRSHTIDRAGELSLPVLNSPVGSRSDADYKYACRE